MTQNPDMTALIEHFSSTQSSASSVNAWVDLVAGRIITDIPSLASDAVLDRLIRASARSQWTAFLASITQPERDIPILPSAAEVAAELARRGHQVTVLFQIYRVARRAIWGYITDVLSTAAPRSEESQFLIFVWTRAGTWLDSVVEGSATVFESERDKVRQGAAAHKLVAVRALIEGDVALTPREASAALGGHPLSGTNTAVLLYATDLDRVSDLRETALELAQLAGSRNPLLVSPGGRELWMWLATRSAPDTSRFASMRSGLDERQIVVTVGSPAEGLEGFRLSHREASRAQQMAFASRRLPNPLVFTEVEALAMLWQSPQDAARFVARTLGPLTEDTEAMARLRQTAQVAINTKNLEQAGDILVVHSNTVRYRLGQIEKSLGRPVNEKSADLALALMYHEAFLADSS